MWLARWLGGLSCGLALSSTQAAGAQTMRDQGVPRVAMPSAAPIEPAKSRFHDSLLVLDQSVTTQTLGVGQRYLSDNPTYDLTFRLWPRYYLLENRRRDLSLRADLRLAREFSDSDTTTRRGEWAFYDTELWLAWSEHLRVVEEERTSILLRFPYLVVPTSKASAGGGRILGVGAGTGVDQEVPLRGPDAAFLPRGKLSARATYSYHFARANVTTNDSVQRIRVDPEGRSAPSDQLTGSAVPQHVLLGSVRLEAQLVEPLTWSTDVGFRYDRRYALAEDVEICNVGTGCVAPIRFENASRSTVRTIFATELSYKATDYLAASLGYINIAAQLGEDGQRRNLLYSPWARFYVSLGVTLDAAYRAVSTAGSARPASSAARASRQARVF